MHFGKNKPSCTLPRRKFLWELGGGIAGLALVDILKRKNLLASADLPPSPLLPKKPHFEPKAKAVISLFMNGGTSHVDTTRLIPSRHCRNITSKLLLRA